MNRHRDIHCDVESLTNLVVDILLTLNSATFSRLDCGHILVQMTFHLCTVQITQVAGETRNERELAYVWDQTRNL